MAGSPGSSSGVSTVAACVPYGDARVRITGSVRDDRGAPVPAAKVELRFGLNGPAAQVAFTADDGRYDVVAGACPCASSADIRVTKPGYESASRHLHGIKNAERHTVNFLLMPEAIKSAPKRIALCDAVLCDVHIAMPHRPLASRARKGRVVIGPEEQPFPGANVAFRRQGEQHIIQITADHRGRFELPSLDAGLYEFVAWAAGADPDIGWLEVSPSAPTREITLHIRYGA